MLDWKPAGKVANATFQPIVPEHVMYELDSPMIFTFRNEGQLLLAYMCGESPGRSRYIAVPTDASVVARILSGHLSVRRALSQLFCWCLDVAPDGSVIQSWAISLDELPRDALPADDVLLNPSSGPQFAVGGAGRDGGKRAG